MRLRQHRPKARKACSGRALRWGMKGVGLHDGTSAWARTLGKAGILAAGPWRLLLHPHGDHQHPEVTWCPAHLVSSTPCLRALCLHPSVFPPGRRDSLRVRFLLTPTQDPTHLSPPAQSKKMPERRFLAPCMSQGPAHSSWLLSIYRDIG